MVFIFKSNYLSISPSVMTVSNDVMSLRPNLYEVNYSDRLIDFMTVCTV